MAYNNIGLTQSLYSRVAAGYVRRAVRLKILSTQNQQLPEVTTTNVVKIDGPGAEYPVNFDGNRFMKMIHDPRSRRSFVLHNVNNTDVTDAVVSIINHDLETTDADYIQEINKNTSDGFPATEGRTVWDIAYDDEQQILVIAVSTEAATAMPELWAFDLQPYIPQLMTSECNQLRPNPDYLKFYRWEPPTEYMDKRSGSKIKFVAFYKHRFYTWADIRCDSPVAPFSQLGYWNSSLSSAAYTLLQQFGYSPGQSEPFDYDITFPTAWPRHSAWINVAATSTYWGDACHWQEGVTSFNIDVSTGILTLGISATGNGGGNHQMDGCGFEAMGISIDLENQVEEVIDTFSHLVSGVLNPISGNYENAAGTWTGTVDLSGASHVGGLPAMGPIRIKVESVTGGSMVGVKTFSTDVIYVETEFGTVRLAGASRTQGNPADATNYTWHDSAFSYDQGVAHRVGWDYGAASSATAYSFSIQGTVYRAPMGIIDCVGIHTAGVTWKQAGDTTTPTTAPHPTIPEAWEVIDWQFPAGDALWTRMRDCIYDLDRDQWVCAVSDQAYGGLGLWVLRKSTGTTTLTKLVAATSDIDYDHVSDLLLVNSANVCILSDDGDDQGGTTYISNLSIQFMNLDDLAFAAEKFVPTLYYTAGVGPCLARSVIYDYKLNLVGFLTGRDGFDNGEMWTWQPETSVDGTPWDRDARRWWDGSDPDVTIGDDSAVIDGRGAIAAIAGLSFNESKGATSYELTFSVKGFEYLPWVDSVFNDNAGVLSGGYNSGTLADGTKVILQRGIWKGYEWEWFDEGQFFIDNLPATAESGKAALTIGCKGPLSLFTTRAVYEGYHEPTRTDYAGVTLTTADDLTYSYDPGGGVVDDWVLGPPPVVSVNGVESTAYLLDAANGLVTFATVQTGNTITATFSAWDAGTNEAEDILYCILTYPNMLGGPGLDDSYLTRLITGETLTTTDDLTYSFEKNNIASADPTNQIYVDGVPTGAGFTWDYRAGTVTFALAQTGSVITGDCRHYTLQASGVTLKPISFAVRDQSTAYDCINEVVRRVAPNYIIRETRDGKIECDYYTQKTVPDIVISNSDVVLTALSSNPAYDGIATRVISLGEADLSELPNRLLGLAVVDLLSTYTTAPTGWVASLPAITDGSEYTGVATGWGRAWQGVAATVIADVQALAPDGLPMFSIDMGDVYKIETIIFSRIGQAATITAAMVISIWASVDGLNWVKIVNPIEVMTGAVSRFDAGTNDAWVSGSSFRYIRCHLVSVETYKNSKDATDTQIGIGEIQAYPHEVIEGVAVLQDTDPTAVLYDSWGLLKKYGYITRVARGGQPDSSLRTEAACNLDARYTLEEFVRLLDSVDISASYLPALPIYSTVQIINSATLEIDKTIFIENRSFDMSGDSISGVTLP